jgi:hypothetical protein
MTAFLYIFEQAFLDGQGLWSLSAPALVDGAAGEQQFPFSGMMGARIISRGGISKRKGLRMTIRLDAARRTECGRSRA